jgi:hypothetical protein
MTAFEKINHLQRDRLPELPRCIVTKGLYWNGKHLLLTGVDTASHLLCDSEV